MQAILSGVLLDAERHFHARREGREIPCPALSTGFHDLDKRFAGGLWPGEVVVVAARPSVGKTTLVLNIARKIACQPPEKQPVPVALFSLEMPREQVSKNILCAEGHILSQRMRNYAFDEEEFESVQLAAGNLKKAPLFIDDTPGLSPAELRARARRLRHREKVGLIAIDYLQLMQPAKKADSREQAVSDMSRQVKHLARELNIPILLISQLRRPIQGQENHKPHLSDLRESGAIEQDADVVIMLHRDMDELGVMGKDVTAIVQKNRNGETGEVRLSFFPEQFRFESYSPAFDEGVAKEA
jgi:replicative DNA helicase